MDEEKSVTTIQADGIWRPEEWRGRYLVVRHLAIPTGGVDEAEQPTFHFKREICCASRFGADAIIFESLETAEAECSKLNSAAAAEEDAPQSSVLDEEEPTP